MTVFNLKELLENLNRGLTPQQIQDFQNADVNDIYSARKYGVTPTEARQRQALDARQRAEERLGLIKPLEDHAAQYAARNGIVSYNSPKEVTQMSQQERFENFLGQKIPDPQMQRDAKELSHNLLAYRYGQPFADYIQNQRQQAMGDVVTASQYATDKSSTAWYNPRVVGSAILKGGLHIGGAIVQDTNMVAYDGDEETNALMATDKKMKEHLQDLSDFQGINYGVQEHTSQVSDTLSEKYRLRREREIFNETGNKDYAKQQAEEEADKYNWALTRISEELIANGVGEQIPQLAAALLSGGIGEYAVQKGTKAAVNAVIKRKVAEVAAQRAAKGRALDAAKQAALTSRLSGSAAQKIANSRLASYAGTSLGVGLEAGYQDGMSANVDAQIQAKEYLDSLSDEGWEMVKRTSPAAQKFIEENPDQATNDAAIREAIIKDAGNRAFLHSGLYTGLSAGVLAPITTSTLSMKKGLVGGLKRAERILAAGANPVVEGLTEHGEEYQNIVAPKSAVNAATGQVVYENPSRYALNKAATAGVIGAVAGSGSTVSAAGSAARTAFDYLKSDKSPLTKGVNKATEALSNVVETRDAKRTSSIIGTDNDVGSLTNRKFHDTNFGKVYKEIENSWKTTESNFESVKKAVALGKTGEYSRVINSMEKELREIAESGDQAKTDAAIKEYNETRTKLVEALSQDLANNENLKDFFEAENALNGLNEIAQKGMEAVQAGNTDEKSKLDEEFNAIIEKFGTSEELQRIYSEGARYIQQSLAKTPLYSQLTAPAEELVKGEVQKDFVEFQSDPTTEKNNVYFSVDAVIDAISSGSTLEEVVSKATGWAYKKLKSFEASLGKNNKLNFDEVTASYDAFKAEFEDIKASLENNGKSTKDIKMLSLVEQALAIADQYKASNEQNKFLAALGELFGVKVQTQNKKLLRSGILTQAAKAAVSGKLDLSGSDIDRHFKATAKRLEEAAKAVDYYKNGGQGTYTAGINQFGSKTPVTFEDIEAAQNYYDSVKGTFSLLSSVAAMATNLELAKEFNPNAAFSKAENKPSNTGSKTPSKRNKKSDKGKPQTRTENPQQQSNFRENEGNPSKPNPEPEKKDSGQQDSQPDDFSDMKFDYHEGTTEDEDSGTDDDTATDDVSDLDKAFDISPNQESEPEEEISDTKNASETKPNDSDESDNADDLAGAFDIGSETSQVEDNEDLTEEKKQDSQNVAKPESKPVQNKQNQGKKPEKQTQENKKEDQTPESPKSEEGKSVDEDTDSVEVDNNDTILSADEKQEFIKGRVISAWKRAKSFKDAEARVWNPLPEDVFKSKNMVSISHNGEVEEVPVEFIRALNVNGLIAGRNVFEETTEIKNVEKGKVRPVIKSLLENEEEFKQAVELENYDDVAKFLGLSHKEGDTKQNETNRAMAYGFVHAMRAVDTYYSVNNAINESTATPAKGKEADEQAFSLTGFLNHGQIAKTSKGRYRFIPDFNYKVTLAMALMGAFRVAGEGNHFSLDTYTDYFDEKGFRNPVITDISAKFHSLKYLNEGYEAVKSSKNDILSLGYSTAEFSKLMSNLAKDFFWFKLKKGMPEDSRIAIERYFGIELMGILNHMGAVREYIVKDERDDTRDEKNKVGTLYYYNFTANTTMNDFAKQGQVIAKDVSVTSLQAAVASNDVGLKLYSTAIGKEVPYYFRTHEVINTTLEKVDGYKELLTKSFEKEQFVIGSRKSGVILELARHQIIDNNLLGDTGNPRLKEAIKRQESVPYGFSNIAKSLFKNFGNEEQFNADLDNIRKRVGYDFNAKEALKAQNKKNIKTEELKVLNKYTDDALTRALSLNDEIDRAIKQLIKVYEAAQEQNIEIDDLAVYLPSVVQENQRLMISSLLNPQSNKFVREMLIATEAVNTKTPEEAKTGLEALQKYVNDDGIISVSGNLNFKFTPAMLDQMKDSSGSERVSKFVNLALTKRNGQNTLLKHNLTIKGIAQGLGIKVEKKKFNSIREELTEKLNNDENLKTLIEFYTKELSNKDGTLIEPNPIESAAFDAVAKKEGTAVHRYLSAVRLAAEIGMKNSKSISGLLYLEADGIANGYSNLNEQFGTATDSKYWDTLNRTGIQTVVDIFSWLSKKLGNLNKVSDEKILETMKGYEGAAELFDNGENSIKDIYEAVALEYGSFLDTKVTELIKLWGTYKNKGDDLDSDLSIINSSVGRHVAFLKEEKENGTVSEEDVYNETSNLRDTVGFMGYLLLTGSTKSDRIFSLTFEGTSDALINASTKFLEVARNLAKQVVTPVTYGGKLKGILNQLSLIFKDSLRSRTQEILELFNTPTKEAWEEGYEKLVLLREHLGLFYYNAAEGQIDEVVREQKIFNSTLDTIKARIEKNDSRYFSQEAFIANIRQDLNELNKDVIATFYDRLSSVGKTGIAGKLQSILNNVGGNAVTNADISVASDAANFRNFSTRLNKDIENYLLNQNKTNERKDPFDQRIILTVPREKFEEFIRNNPYSRVLATAYSRTDSNGSFENVTQLVDDLYTYGNGIIKKEAQKLDTEFKIQASSKADSNSKFIHSLMAKVQVEFTAGGATNFTNSVVSTESNVQQAVHEWLAVLGLADLNVYDGLDAQAMMAQIVSLIANKANFQVHTELNLPESFYHRYVTSGMSTFILQKLNKVPPTTGKGTTTLNELYALKDLALLKGLTDKLNGLRADGVYLAYANFDKMVDYFKRNKENFNDDTPFSISEYNSKVNWREQFKYNIKLSRELGAVIEDIKSVSDTKLKIRQIIFAFENRFKWYVGEAQATKDVRKILPANINQYGGSASGYLANKEGLTGNNSILKRFGEFVEIKRKEASINDPDSKNTVMRDFIFFDEELHSIFKNSAEKKTKELPSTVDAGKLLTKDDGFNVFTLNEKKELVVSENLNNWGINSKAYTTLQKGVLNSLLHIMLKINSDKFRELKISKNLLSSNNPQIRDGNIKGAYDEETNTIYLKDLSIKTLIHELVHVLEQSVIEEYLSVPIQNRLNHAKDLIAGIERVVELVGGVQKLSVESNIDFAKDSKKFAEEFYADLRNGIANSSPLEVIAKYLSGAKKLASAHHALKGNELANVTLFYKEALSYALSEENSLVVLRYRKGIVSQVIQTIKDTLYKIFMGYVKDTDVNENSQNKIDFDKSLLSQMLGTLYETSKSYAGRNNPSNTGTVFSVEANTNNFTLSGSEEHKEFTNRILEQFIGKYSKLSKDLNIKVKDSKRTNAILDTVGRMNVNNTVYLKNLAEQGMDITQDEVSAFGLAFAMYELNFDSSNSSLRVDAEAWLHNILQNIEPEKMGNLYDAIFDNSKTMLSKVLALATIKEDVRQQLEAALPLKHKNKSEELKKLAENISNPAHIFKLDNKNTNTQALAIAASQLVLDNQVLPQNRLKLLEELEKQNVETADLIATVGKLSEITPDIVSAAVRNIVIPAFTDDSKNIRKSRNYSALGDAIASLSDEYQKLRGREDLLAKVVRWIIGQRESTELEYALRGQAANELERLRERVTKVAATTVRDGFTEIKYTPELDNHVAKALIKPKVNFLYSSISGSKELVELLRSQEARDKKIDEVKADLVKKLQTVVKGGSNQTLAFNYLNWQTEGLADIMVTNEAKAEEGKSHNILPNTRAIASLYSSNIQGVSEEALDTLLPEVRALTSLYALNQTNKESLEVVADMFTNDLQGAEKIIEAQIDLQRTLDNGTKGGNLLGADAYIHSKKDSTKDFQIVTKGSKKEALYLSYGYRKIAELDRNKVVLYTSGSIFTGYQTGVFGIGEYTFNGINGHSLKPIQTYEDTVFFDDVKDYRKFFIQNSKEVSVAARDPNYYANLTHRTTVKPVINADGEVLRYAVDLPYSIENLYSQPTEQGIDSVGNMNGRIVEEEVTIANNDKYVDILNQKYRDAKDKSKFIKINGEYISQGKSNADIQFQKRVNEFYAQLPERTREYIDSVGGLYLYRGELDNTIGYNRLSIVNVFNDNNGFPKEVRAVAKAVVDLFSASTGFNLIKSLRQTELLVSEVASRSKDFVLNRSGVVPATNLMSNVIHLWNVGVPVNKIYPLMKEGLVLAQNYSHAENRVEQINYQLRTFSLSGSEKKKLLAERVQLENMLNNSPVKPLVDAGMLSSVTGQVAYESAEDSNDYFSYYNKALRFAKVDKLLEGDSKAVKVISNALIMDNTGMHDFMVRVLDYGDFVAKYALFKHLKQKGYDNDAIIPILREEFVNYSMNRGAEFDWLNKSGLTWFLSYKLAIQKIIFRLLRQNLLRTMAVYGLEKAIVGNNPLGLYQTVSGQNLLWDSSVDYQTDPENIIKGFESHWLHLAYKILFGEGEVLR